MLSLPLFGLWLARAKRPAKDPNRLEPPGVVTDPYTTHLLTVKGWQCIDLVCNCGQLVVIYGETGLTSLALSTRLDMEVAVTSNTS